MGLDTALNLVIACAMPFVLFILNSMNKSIHKIEEKLTPVAETSRVHTEQIDQIQRILNL